TRQEHALEGGGIARGGAEGGDDLGAAHGTPVQGLAARRRRQRRHAQVTAKRSTTQGTMATRNAISTARLWAKVWPMATSASPTGVKTPASAIARRGRTSTATATFSV